MTLTGWVILGLSLGGGVLVALFSLCWHLAYKDGYDDGRDYERERAYLKAIRAEQDRGRRSPSPAAVPWYQPVPPRPVRHRAVTAAGPVPVTVVPVGPALIPMRPQPPRISNPGTVAMGRLTDTGELRALTDEFIEGLEARAERDRQELTS